MAPSLHPVYFRIIASDSSTFVCFVPILHSKHPNLNSCVDCSCDLRCLRGGDQVLCAK